MSYYSGYMFDNLSRIGLDQCNMDQNAIQNTNACNYMTTNFYNQDCTMSRPIDFATAQPGIMYVSGCSEVGPNGCNVDASSRIKIGTIQTNPPGRIQLMQRPFITVPYLGRGSVNPVIESQLLQGEQVAHYKKSANPFSEKSYYKYSQLPLLPEVKQHIRQSSAIESDIYDGWIRGGIPSRELTKDRSD